jgi:Peptidyl-prolyl cis-trans isomerase (rotamase) - cyclophilin family
MSSMARLTLATGRVVGFAPIPKKEALLNNVIFGFLAVTVIACTPANTANTDTAATKSDTITTSSASTTASTTDTSVAPPASPTTAAEEKRPMSQYQNKVAELHTSAGEIDIRFFPDIAPNHVKNFIDLAEKGFYNGTKFHRVIPGFMIQGGDPNTVSGSPSTWGTGDSGKKVAAEFSAVSHKRGIVSMARSSDPNSASSQFFIVTKDSTFLDNQYTVFGQVTKGMDIADKIVNAPKGEQDRPNDPTSIEKIVIREAKDGEKGPTPK